MIHHPYSAYLYKRKMLLLETEYYVSPYQGLLDKLLESDVSRDRRLSFIMYDALFGKNWLGETLFDPPK